MGRSKIELEEKIAFLEKLTSDLDGVVCDLNGRIRKLERDLEMLRVKYDQHLLDLHEPEIAGGEE